MAYTLHNLLIGRLVSCQEAARRMIDSKRGGSIINIVSIAGINALGRSHLAYSIGMGGAAQMTRELSTEWAALGVRVNAIVCAQLMNEELERRIAADPGLGETYLRGIPMGRIGDSNDIKGVAIFLASKAGTFATGQNFVIDGGDRGGVDAHQQATRRAGGLGRVGHGAEAVRGRFFVVNDRVHRNSARRIPGRPVLESPAADVRGGPSAVRASVYRLLWLRAA